MKGADVASETDEKPKETGPVALIETYVPMFAEALPVQLDVVQFVRQGIAALRRDPRLLAAAKNNPIECTRVFMDAARLGHVPGTPQYYLTPRWNGKTKREEITGIEGYRGIIQRMYRSGQVANVTVAIVHEHDEFSWRPGLDTHPRHIPAGGAERHGGHFGRSDDRGEWVGVYAYATMASGAISQVIIMSREEVYEHRANSDSYTNEKSRPYSPWVTNEPKMVKKTALRDLEPYVPTATNDSSFLKDMMLAAAEADRAAVAGAATQSEGAMGEVVDGEVEPDSTSDTETADA